MDLTSQLATVLPEDADRALLVARVHDPGAGGPCVAAVRGDTLADLTPLTPTVADLLDRDDARSLVRDAPAHRSWRTADVLHDTLAGRRTGARLLAPCDLQVVKACGVTFVRSMIERVIEERAKGDPARAADVRARVESAVGGAIGALRPGSAEAARAKELLVAEGLWSQYLEVGIGPDAEVFTKAPVLASVGTGEQIGVPSASHWNNPEPELVLAVDSRGRAVGATLGNDVNLRDVEGRSALLLSKAKDNNASCAIGPFIRLFDTPVAPDGTPAPDGPGSRPSASGGSGAGFGIEDVRALDIHLDVTGPDGYTLTGISSMREISRDPLELVRHAMGPLHQYPDGIMLFTGTLFAPTDDRDAPGMGFTHKPGDVVRISSPPLGSLVNTVAYADEAPPWTFGVRALMTSLAARGLLPAGPPDGSR